jgi:hypothetical protein
LFEPIENLTMNRMTMNSILNRFDESVRNNQSLLEPVFELRSDFQSVRTKINRFNNPKIYIYIYL